MSNVILIIYLYYHLYYLSNKCKVHQRMRISFIINTIQIMVERNPPRYRISSRDGSLIQAERSPISCSTETQSASTQTEREKLKMANAIRFFELNTGAKIPSVGLGTYRADTHVVSDVIAAAIKIGYRHIDCAQMYGNEKEIGDALKKLFNDGVVKREDIWITSKLWCSDHEPEDVPKAFDKTLQDLQLDYLDLYLVHWPVSMKKGSVGSDPHNLTQPNIPSTWKAMEALFDSGKARAIGVCNFSSKKLGDLLEVARIPPAVNQVELHPHWQQLKLHAFCKSKGIHLTGFAPLARNKVLTNPIVNLVAEKLGKTTAQVTLRWGLQMGHSLVPKSTNPERIRENFDIFDWSIPEDLFAKFSEINQERLIKGTGFVHETLGAYRTVEELWDGE